MAVTRLFALLVLPPNQVGIVKTQVFRWDSKLVYLGLRHAILQSKVSLEKTQPFSSTENK